MFICAYIKQVTWIKDDQAIHTLQVHNMDFRKEKSTTEKGINQAQNSLICNMIIIFSDDFIFLNLIYLSCNRIPENHILVIHTNSLAIAVIPS